MFGGISKRLVSSKSIGIIESSKVSLRSGVCTRWFSESSGDDKTTNGKKVKKAISDYEEHTPEVLAWRKIITKRREEKNRFIAEKAAYNKKMTELRKEFLRESKILAEDKEKARRAIEEANHERVREINEELDRRLEKRKQYLTKLETPIIELLQKTPEELEIERLEKKEEKLRRRQHVVEKLQKQHVEQQLRKEAMLSALAEEADSWIMAEDLENGTLDEKISAKLEPIQAITAPYESVLPHHHHDDAKMFISNDLVPFRVW